MDFEHAILAFGRDFAVVDIVGKREAPRERAVERFASMLFLVLGRLLDAAFAAYRQNAVLDLDLDIL